MERERISKKDTLNRALERKGNELFDPAGATGLFLLGFGYGSFTEPPIIAPNCQIGKRSSQTRFCNFERMEIPIWERRP